MKSSKQKLTEYLLTEIQRGIRMTTDEWADQIFPGHRHGSSRTRSIIAQLRRRGELIFPEPQPDGSAGPLVWMNDNPTLLASIYNRHAIRFVEGSLKSNASIAQKVMDSHPKLRGPILEIFKAVVAHAEELQQGLLEINYVSPVKKKSIQ